MIIGRSLHAGFLLTVAAPLSWGAAPDHWVGTWATASYPSDNQSRRPMADANQVTVEPGVFGGRAETIREIVHVSLGGGSVRVELSNEYGSTPLTVGAASVAVAGGGSARGDSLQTLAFGGRGAITIPPGAVILSDPVNLRVEPLSDLAISLYLPEQAIPTLTVHANAVQTNQRIPGNAVAQAEPGGGEPFFGYVFLKDVQVLAPAEAGAIVAFGDSITDGRWVTPDSNMRWPDELSRRLQANKRTRSLGVLNAGINGNRVLHTGSGPSALARLATDALDQPGVRYVILLEAINDIGRAYQPSGPTDVVTADDLIQGYEQVIARAHEHGIKVIGATLTPYVGAGYSSAAGEGVRSAVNQWIRTSQRFDGVIDFDAITRDPAQPSVLKPSVDHGDHLHPGDAGYKAMGDGIDLGLFAR